MKIAANVAYNADKLVNKNYKNPNTSETKVNDSDSSKSEDSSFVSKLVETIFGNTNNNEKIKSNNDAKSNGFDSEIEKIFSEIMSSSSMSRSKFYLKTNYKRLLKDEAEFEALIQKLKDTTMSNKEGAEYALSLFKGFVKEAEKNSSSPEEVVSKVVSSVKNFIKGFNPDEGVSSASLAKDILKSALITGEGSLDKISSFTENSLVYDEKGAQDLFDTLSKDIERSKKYNFLRSTRNYLKHYKNDEEFNQKMLKISDLKYTNASDTMGGEVENLIKEIKSSSETNPDKQDGNDHVTDLNRLNADIYSPALI